MANDNHIRYSKNLLIKHKDNPQPRLDYNQNYNLGKVQRLNGDGLVR